MNDESDRRDAPQLNWSVPPPAKPPAGSPCREKAILRLVGESGSEPAQWIWPGWVPRSKLTLLAGYPGVGKSYLALDVLARFTARLPWPGPVAPPAEPAPGSPVKLPEGPGPQAKQPGRAIIVTAEDHPDDTISWRFASAGGDPSRVMILDSVGRTASLDEDPSVDSRDDFSIGTDLYLLDEIVRHWPRVELIVFDPIVVHRSAADRETHLWHALAQLTRFAVAHGVAILAIAHLRDDPAKTDIYKALGSRALASIPRTIFTVQTDPADAERRLVLPLKMNLGPAPPGLAFHFGDNRLIWHNEPIHRMASDRIAAEDPQQTVIVEATKFLRATLAEKEVPATEILGEGAKHGFSPRTMYRAKALLKAVSNRKGFGPTSTFYWSQHSPPTETRSER